MKTPEEIKKGEECCRPRDKRCECPYYGEDWCSSNKNDAALALIRQLEAQVPKWISVHDALPGMDEKVLFHPMCNEKSIYIGKLTYVGESNAVYFAVNNWRRKVVYSLWSKFVSF